MTEQRKAVIKNADMSEDMQQDAVDCASQALSKYNIEKVREHINQVNPTRKLSIFSLFLYHRAFMDSNVPKKPISVAALLNCWICQVRFDDRCHYIEILKPL